MSVFVIAEAGVNHNGDKEMALALIDAAVDAGADAVKFQTFKAEELASADAPKAAYQNQTTDKGETQLEMLKRLELPHGWHRDLMDRCLDRGVEFLSTPFDSESLDFLVDELNLETLKIPSGEITNGPLLLQAGISGCDIILSTGMSTLDEIEAALGVLAFGLTDADGKPSRDAFKNAFASDQGQAALKEKVTVLHCTTEYPAPFEDANLKAMETMRDEFGLRVGLSDHTEGIAVAIAAVALGATAVEKHFTLDRTLPGPDHRVSLEPGELKDMVSGIRAVEQALGDGEKNPRPSEAANRGIVRKSLVAARDLAKGETIAAADLKAKRPGTGVSPMEYWDRLGKILDRDVAEDELI